MRTGKAVRILVSIAVILGLILSFVGGVYCMALFIKKDMEKLVDNNIAATNESLNYREQIDLLKKEIEEAKKNNLQLTQDITDLEQANNSASAQLAEAPDITFYTPEYIQNGLKIEVDGNEGVAVINKRPYVAADLLGPLLGWPSKFYESNNTLTLGDEDDTITRIDVMDMDNEILYNGEHLTRYMPKEGESFTMGGKAFTKGFTIGYGGFYGYNTGNALFNLDGKYSSISFDVGRLDSSAATDVTMKIFINDELVETYELLATTPVKSYEINLDYANSLEIEIGRYDDHFDYGFTNIILTK